MFCPFMLFVRLSENSALFWAQKSIASFTVAPHFVYLVDASVLDALQRWDVDSAIHKWTSGIKQTVKKHWKSIEI